MKKQAQGTPCPAIGKMTNNPLPLTLLLLTARVTCSLHIDDRRTFVRDLSAISAAAVTKGAAGAPQVAAALEKELGEWVNAVRKGKGLSRSTSRGSINTHDVVRKEYLKAINFVWEGTRGRSGTTCEPFDEDWEEKVKARLEKIKANNGGVMPSIDDADDADAGSSLSAGKTLFKKDSSNKI